MAFKSSNTFETEGVDDLVLLPKVTEEGITENIRKRYMLDRIYTNIGPVLLSVNPFRHIPGVCDNDQIAEYKNRFRYEVPPNIFALAEEAYRELKNNENQCVIITGESGAGKTEAAKLIMKYVSAVSGESDEINYVKSVIFDSNPLLEAFGNAKTLRNNNSSRFGKYFEIQFDRYANPVGGKINHYILEKSRVVRQIQGERSFHVFYQLFAGASREDIQSMKLFEPKNYSYLAQSGTFTVDNVDDAKDFSELCSSMDTVGITQDEKRNIWGMLAGILHLGNIQFSERGDGVAIQDENALVTSANMFGANPDKLRSALLSRTLTTGAGSTAETYQVPNNKIQADAARNSLAKTIYSRIFDWIVNKTNIALDRYHLPFSCVLGVLDIYGFEIFENNGFEQFCINYVNEKLQQYFIELTLKAEQEEYTSEGIQWNPIKFFNNKVVVDLIEGKNPPGIFSVLDDICSTMHSTESDESDNKFVQKCSGFFNGNLHFRVLSSGFEIKHYAGSVTYNCLGFCDRNKDTITNDLIDVMQGSSNALLVSFFPEDTTSKQTRRPTTAGFKIKTSCQSLIKALSECSPHYIRTIKPNETKRASDWNDERVNHQVKYLGLLENVRVRRAGFAFRAPYERFVSRYKKLSNQTWGINLDWNGNMQEGTKLILQASQLDAKQWQLGRTKIFIRHPESLFYLEESLERFDYERAALIQKAWRNWKGKKKALEIRAKAANLFRNKKERRRDSLNVKFEGDYLNYDKNFPLQQALTKYRDERVIFADQVVRFNKRGHAERRDFILTPQAFYVSHRVTRNRQTVYTLDRRTAINQIQGVYVSTFQDNNIILQAEGNDLWMECTRKTELVTCLSELFENQLRMQLRLTFSDNNTINLPNGFTQTVTFSKNESAQRANINKKGKAFTVTIASGLPSSTDTSPQSTSSSQGITIPPASGGTPNRSGDTNKGRSGPGQPQQSQNQQSRNANFQAPQNATPSAPKFPKTAPRPAVPRCKALYDYPGDGQTQLAFKTGDIIEILQKDPGGWWEGVLNGNTGWIPANYVEDI